VAAGPFNITINSGSDSSFILPIKPDTTNNLLVDWGDGTAQTITTSPSTVHNATGIPHSYPAANTNYQIAMYGTTVRSDRNIGGICGFGFFWQYEGYGVPANRAKVRSIDSDILSLLPSGTPIGSSFLNEAFLDCTGLTSISDDFLSGITGEQEHSFLFHTFLNTALTAIPDDFLSGVTGPQGQAFLQTCFYGCTALTSASPVDGSGAKLYDRVSGNQVGLECFRGNTQMADYDEIPEYWVIGLRP
jgi:hypothetical protein